LKIKKPKNLTFLKWVSTAYRPTIALITQVSEDIHTAPDQLILKLRDSSR